MTIHPQHKTADWLVFGKAFPEVHKAIDSPWKTLGRWHRIKYHDEEDAFKIGFAVTGKIEGGLAGVLHTRIDNACSRNPVFKRNLELVHKTRFLRKTSRKKRKRKSRKKKGKTSGIYYLFG